MGGRIKIFSKRIKRFFQDKKRWQPTVGFLAVVLFVVASVLINSGVWAKFYRTEGPDTGFLYGYGYGYELGFGYGYGYHQKENLAEYGFFGADGKALNVQIIAKTDSSLTISYTTTYTAKNRIEYGTSNSFGSCSPDCDWGNVNWESSGTHFLTLTGLIADTPYFYRVASQDAGGNFWYTATASNTTTATGEIIITSSGVNANTQVTVSGITTTVSEAFSSIGVTTTEFSKASLISGVNFSLFLTDLDGSVTINIPAGTVIYAATNSFTSIPAPAVDPSYSSTSSLAVGSTNYYPVGKVIEFGIPNISLIFDKLVTVTIPNVPLVPAKIVYSVDGTIWRAISQCDSDDISDTTPSPSFPGACFGYDNNSRVITLKTYHFTKFGGAITTPTVTTNSVSSVSRTAVTLNGTITATGGPNVTSRGFQYGKTASYGLTVSETGTYGTGAFNLSVSGLRCGTTYHFRAFAINDAGTSYGSDNTFTTNSCAGGIARDRGYDTTAPLISNIKVIVADTYATISWQTDEPSWSWVVYGVSTSYGLEKKITSYVSSHSLTLTGLSPQTIYYYQIKSKDSAGNISSSTDRTFTTLALGEKPRLEMTIEEMKAEITRIAGLIAQIRAELLKLKGCSTITSFERNLKLGMMGDDVKCLQIILNSDSDTRLAVSGVGSSGQETTYFGLLTQAAVIKFQEKYASEILTPWKITKGTGFVGSFTRSKLNQKLGEMRGIDVEKVK